MVVIGNTGVLTAQYREPEQAETNCHCAFYFTLHVTCLAVTWPPALFRLYMSQGASCNNKTQGLQIVFLINILFIAMLLTIVIFVHQEFLIISN